MPEHSTQVSEVEQRQLLTQKVSELPKFIKGTRLKKLVVKLYEEMEKAGISFKPETYLSDSWGCPDRIPVIGIPFYLSDRRLCTLVGEMNDCPAESDAEILVTLRHEAGHAFNYAYRLYTEPEWEQVFGPFSAPYQERYPTRPFSSHFVRYIAGWYAQKHPDEDFAETFAVWLTPDSHWSQRYAGTPALAKLQYIDDAVHRYGRRPPLVTQGNTHRPVEEINVTLAEWCRMAESDSQTVELPDIIKEDLRRLFPAAEGESAADFLWTNRHHLLREIHAWTGLDSNLLNALLQTLRKMIDGLGLKIETGKREEAAVNLAIFVDALAMNYQQTGQFIET
jgi:hypothetical protein